MYIQEKPGMLPLLPHGHEATITWLNRHRENLPAFQPHLRPTPRAFRRAKRCRQRFFKTDPIIFKTDAPTCMIEKPYFCRTE